MSLLYDERAKRMPSSELQQHRYLKPDYFREINWRFKDGSFYDLLEIFFHSGFPRINRKHGQKHHVKTLHMRIFHLVRYVNEISQLSQIMLYNA